MKKVLLLNLPNLTSELNVTPRFVLQHPTKYPPLGLLQLIPELEKINTKISLIDANALNYDFEDTINSVVKETPDVLGISITTPFLWIAYRLAKQIKNINPKIKIIVGGPHLYVAPMETIMLEPFDFAMAGECEFSFSKFIETLDSNKDLSTIEGLYYKSGNQIIEPKIPPAYIKDLDKSPFISSKYLQHELYYTIADSTTVMTMVTSRGCPYNCTFCDVLNKKFRHRSPDNIIKQLEILLSERNYTIHFFDDCFNVDLDFVKELCQKIIDNKLKFNWTCRARINPFDEEVVKLMKDAGCRRANFGVESHDDGILREIKKGQKVKDIIRVFELFNKCRIETVAFVILGFPGQTLKSCKNTISFMKTIKATYPYFNIFTPLAKTKLYKQLLSEDRFESDFWATYVKNPETECQIPEWRKEPEPTTQELYRIMMYGYRKYYLSPKFLLNQIFKGNSKPYLVAKIKFGLSVIFGNKLKRILKKLKVKKTNFI